MPNHSDNSYPATETAHSGVATTRDTTIGALLDTRLRELKRLTTQLSTSPVTGARGELLSVAEAHELHRLLVTQIRLEELRGSRRHRPASRAAKIVAGVFLGVVDLPIMLWLTSAVFNVNWSRPFGVPLAVSIVITILATCGVVVTLYHLGQSLRENKTERGGLKWGELTLGARLRVIAAYIMVVLVAVLMQVRIYSEGVLSGVPGIALLLSLLASVVMLASAGLVFHTAFRDGSPERDDLVHYSAVLRQVDELRKRLQRETAAQQELYENVLPPPSH